MSSLSVTVSHRNPGALGAVSSNVLKSLEKELQKSAILIAGKIQKSLQYQGTGRIYKRGSHTHQASSPGSPPSTDTGELVASIRVVKGAPSALVGYGDFANLALNWSVTTKAPYASFLEKGTKKMAARPFFLNQFYAQLPSIAERLAYVIKQAGADSSSLRGSSALYDTEWTG